MKLSEFNGWIDSHSSSFADVVRQLNYMSNHFPEVPLKSVLFLCGLSSAFNSPSLIAQEVAEPKSETQEAVIPQPEQSSPEPTSQPRNNYRTSVGLGLSLAGTAKWDDLSISSGIYSFSGEAEIDFKQTISLGFDVKMNYEPNSWGFGFGAWYDAKRKVDGGHITIAGSRTELTGEDAATLSQTVAYGNAVYRWQTMYTNFGFNYNLVEYNAPSSFQGSVDVDGGLGLQIGIGGDINEKLALELTYRQTYLSIKQSVDDVSADFGDGYLSLIYLGARIYLN